MSIYMKIKYIIIFFIAGVLYRLWLIHLVPQPFVYDQNQYLSVAWGILQHGLYADYSRLYGYGLLIAPFIKLFGLSNPFPWQLLQAILDTSSAFLVYFIGKKIFKTERAAFWGFILYLFNPFTSAYVGVMLTEIAAIFFMVLVFFIYLHFLETRKISLLLLLGFILGYFVQVRPSFLYFTLLFLVWLLFLVCKTCKPNKRKVELRTAVIPSDPAQCGRAWESFIRLPRHYAPRNDYCEIRDKVILCIILPIIYFIPFSYNIAANYKTFHQFAILSVDKFFFRDVYVSLIVDKVPRTSRDPYYFWPGEALYVWGVYSTPKTAIERKDMADKYFQLGMTIIKKDPLKFIVSRVRKMRYVWEKHYLFPYRLESTNAIINFLVYWTNAGFLVMALFGLIMFARKRKNEKSWAEKQFIYIIIFLFIYITLAHMFSTGEERFSLPAYPFVFMFAGFGIYTLQNRLLGRYNKLRISQLSLRGPRRYVGGRGNLMKDSHAPPMVIGVTRNDRGAKLV